MLLDRDHLALGVLLQDLHDVERLVQDDLDALAQPLSLQGRVHIHAHLASGREHVDGGVIHGLHEHAEGRRRLGELLHLFLQRLDLLALGLQRGNQLLVLAQGAG